MHLRTFVRPLLTASVAAVCLSAAPASASLVFLGTTDDLGAGLGNVNTILSFSPQGNGTTTCGQITFGDVTANCGGSPTTFAGGSNNQTYTFGELGITDAADLRFIFNINESDDLVTLTSLSALFYTTAGVNFHTANYAGEPALPFAFPELGSGVGGQGYVFGLNAAEAAIVNTRLALGDVVVGARFSVMNAGGGFETLNISMAEDEMTVPGDNVPEPTSLLLLGTALLGVGALRRRR